MQLQEVCVCLILFIYCANYVSKRTRFKETAKCLLFTRKKARKPTVCQSKQQGISRNSLQRGASFGGYRVWVGSHSFGGFPSSERNPAHFQRAWECIIMRSPLEIAAQVSAFGAGFSTLFSLVASSPQNRCVALAKPTLNMNMGMGNVSCHTKGTPKK